MQICTILHFSYICAKAKKTKVQAEVGVANKEDNHAPK